MKKLMMKTKVKPIVLLLAVATFFFSCHEKKTTRTITTKIEVPIVNTETQSLPSLTTNKHFSWGDTSCDATITRHPDHNLAIVSDTDGNHYYDNVIRLSLVSSGKKLLDREFHASDFKRYIDNSFLNPTRSSLLNIGFSEVEGGEAVFIATVGSPDDMDDEYMIVQVRVSPQGQVSFAHVEELE